MNPPPPPLIKILYPIALIYFRNLTDSWITNFVTVCIEFSDVELKACVRYFVQFFHQMIALKKL